MDFFKDMIRDGADIAADIRGSRYTVTLEDGIEISVRGIFIAESEEAVVNAYGVSQVMPFPRLDIIKRDLENAGLEDPFYELAHASVSIDSKDYTFDQIRADKTNVINVRLANT